LIFSEYSKAAALPPKHVLRALGLKMGKITALPLLGKNSKLTVG
jgi:hypothetical protein